MTRARTLLRKRTISGAIVGLVAAGAIFASGVVVANATMDDDSSHSSALPAITIPGTNSGRAQSLVPPAPAKGALDSGFGSGGTATSPGAATANYFGPGGGCASSIAGALSGTAIDPAKAGFTSNLLKDGFTLTGMSFGSNGACGPDGKPATTQLTLGTQWKVNDSISLMVTQSQGVDENTPNLIQQGNATFVVDGYTYNVWANSNVMPIAVDAGGTTGSDGSTKSAPLPLPIRPQNDPEVAKAIEAAVSQLAPGIGAQCFWRQADGTWTDLSGLGIGDPRPAVPAGFTQNGIVITRFTPPAASCAKSPTAYSGQVSVYAAFADGAGDQVSINVNGSQGDIASGPGHLDDSSASWSSGSYYFSVYGNGSGVNRDVIRGIAVALDPSFANACLISTRMLGDDDVAKLGVHVPAAPSGYKLEQSSFTSFEGTVGCGSSATNAYSLTWIMSNQSQGGYIEAGVVHGTVDPSVGIGNIIDTSLAWQDDAGNRYHVSPLKSDVSRDVLLGVAKSMDPKFSEDRLEKNPGGGSGGIIPPSANSGSGYAVPEPATKPD